MTSAPSTHAMWWTVLKYNGIQEILIQNNYIQVYLHISHGAYLGTRGYGGIIR